MITDSLQCFYTGDDPRSIPVNIVLRSQYEDWKGNQPCAVQNWLQTACCRPEPNQPVCIPDTKGRLASVLVIVERENVIWSLGKCPQSLPAGQYHIAHAPCPSITTVLLDWAGGLLVARERENECPSQPSIMVPKTPIARGMLGVTLVPRPRQHRPRT